MTDIIKLIDDVIDYNASDERPRAALQSAIEALQGDIGSITSANMWLQGEVERLKDINRDALSNLNELCDAKNAEIAALAAELAAVRAVRDQLDKSWHDIARTAQLEAEALQAKLDELQRQEPVKFLVDATRFKTTMLANGKVLINDLPLELAGRWVAFVAAENDCHLKLAAPKALAPEQVEAAWRAGWRACRDAEYVGQEAEDEAWGMNETCANADWESAAPKALAPTPIEPNLDGVVGINNRLSFKVGWKAAEAAHGIGGTP